MGSIYSAFDQVATLLAKLGAKEVMNLKATDEMQERMEQLLKKSRENNLTIEEKDELDHYIVLERLIRLSKARALFRLSQWAFTFQMQTENM